MLMTKAAIRKLFNWGDRTLDLQTHRYLMLYDPKNGYKRLAGDAEKAVSNKYISKHEISPRDLEEIKVNFQFPTDDFLGIVAESGLAAVSDMFCLCMYNDADKVILGLDLSKYKEYEISVTKLKEAVGVTYDDIDFVQVMFEHAGGDTYKVNLVAADGNQILRVFDSEQEKVFQPILDFMNAIQKKTSAT